MTLLRNSRALAWIVALAVIVAYAPAINARFIFDDAPAILQNQTIHTLWPPSIPLHGPAQTPTDGRPIANVSFAISYAINAWLGVDQGSEPQGPHEAVSYHVGNILLHLACGALLFGILVRTLRSGRVAEWWTRGGVPGESVAAAVTALWLLHPVQGEALNYATQRTELLVSFFYLGTLYASIRAWDAKTPKSKNAWYGASIGLCLLGMASKEVMISAPIAVMLYDRAFRSRSWGELRPRAGFYALLSLTIGLLVYLIHGAPRGNSVSFTRGMAWYASTSTPRRGPSCDTPN